MSGLTGIIAGFAVVAGAVAFYRFAGKHLAGAREAMNMRKGTDKSAPVLEFELDRSTGVFRSK